MAYFGSGARAEGSKARGTLINRVEPSVGGVRLITIRGLCFSSQEDEVDPE